MNSFIKAVNGSVDEVNLEMHVKFYWPRKFLRSLVAEQDSAMNPNGALLFQFR